MGRWNNLKLVEMKFFVLTVTAAAFIASIAFAKHPQCAGNTEPEKCEKLRDELDLETQAQKKERVKRFHENRSETNKVISSQQNYKHTPNHQTPRIGMSKDDAADSSWGRPADINRTTTTSGINEQWVYGLRRYLYFTNGKLTAIQE